MFSLNFAFFLTCSSQSNVEEDEHDDDVDMVEEKRRLVLFAYSSIE
jgi:hypothetical protein